MQRDSEAEKSEAETAVPETWKIVVAVALIVVFFLFVYYRHVSDLKQQDRVRRARRNGDSQLGRSDQA